MAAIIPFPGRVWGTLTDAFHDLPIAERLWFYMVYSAPGHPDPAHDLTAIEASFLSGLCAKYRIELQQPLAQRDDGVIAIGSLELFMTRFVAANMYAPFDIALRHICQAVRNSLRVPFAWEGNIDEANFEYDHVVLPAVAPHGNAAGQPARFGMVNQAVNFGANHNVQAGRPFARIRVIPNNKEHIAYLVRVALRNRQLFALAEQKVHRYLAHFICALSQRGSVTAGWINKRSEAFRVEMRDETLTLNAGAIQMIWGSWMSKLVFPEILFAELQAYLVEQEATIGLRMMLTVQHSALKGLTAYTLVTTAFSMIPALSPAWEALARVIPEDQIAAYFEIKAIVTRSAHVMYSTRDRQQVCRATRYTSLAYFGFQFAQRVLRDNNIGSYHGTGSNRNGVAQAGAIDNIIRDLQQEIGRDLELQGLELGAQGIALRDRARGPNQDPPPNLPPPPGPQDPPPPPPNNVQQVEPAIVHIPAMNPIPEVPAQQPALPLAPNAPIPLPPPPLNQAQLFPVNQQPAVNIQPIGEQPQAIAQDDQGGMMNVLPFFEGGVDQE